jgi:hypothetical protein
MVEKKKLASVCRQAEKVVAVLGSSDRAGCSPQCMEMYPIQAMMCFL